MWRQCKPWHVSLILFDALRRGIAARAAHAHLFTHAGEEQLLVFRFSADGLLVMGDMRWAGSGGEGCRQNVPPVPSRGQANLWTAVSVKLKRKMTRKFVIGSKSMAGFN